MAYVNFKGFPRTTISDKILCSKALNIAKNPKHNCYQQGLASKELHKPNIRKSEKQKVHSPFIEWWSIRYAIDK